MWHSCHLCGKLVLLDSDALGAHIKNIHKMKEKDYETWCAKNREKMRKCIESMSEQKRKEMKRRDAERKREKRAAEKLKRNGGEYKTQAALGKARSKAMKALPSDPHR